MEQNRPLIPNAPSDDIVRVKIPKKRKRHATWASVGICFLAGIGIIVYGLKLDNKAKEYKPVNDLSAATLKAILNGSIKCHIKEEKETYPVLLNLCFGLLAVILGTFVDRLSLIFEEAFHFKTRYKRNLFKMLKACFSGIVWHAVIPLFGILILIIIAALSLKRATLELIHVTYILSGIGVGPLVMHLLNMNTQSDVHVSTILEEKQTFVANGLAWSYYFNYLDNALPKFREMFPNANADIPVQDQGELRCRLSLNKLILLISHDCVTTENLEEHDNTIQKLDPEISHGKFRFPVYQFTYRGEQRRYVIRYVSQQLHTLQMMSEKERIKALSEDELEYQVEMFYQTLSRILKKPFNNNFKDMCILVPIKATSTESLQNGGLVRFIMHQITTDPSTSGHEKGFMMVPPAHQAAQFEGASIEGASIEGSSTSAPVGEHHHVNISPDEGTSQYRKHKDGQHSSEDDQNSAIVHPVQEQENRDGASLQEKKLARQYRTPHPTKRDQRPPNNDDTSTHADVHSNPKQAGKGMQMQRTSPKGKIKMNDRQATTSGEPKETDSTKPIESHPKSCSTNSERAEDKQERKDRPVSKGNVPPISNSTEDTKDKSTSSELANHEETYCKEPARNGTPFQSDNQPISDSEDDEMNKFQHT